MSHRLVHTIVRAQAGGLLPESAAWPAAPERPWPVVLLTALGAWLAAVPLLGAVGLLFGDLFSEGAGAYLVGLLVLAGAVVVLRASTRSLFAEQLAVPALLVGAGSLGFGLFRDLPVAPAAALLAAVVLGLAAALPRVWLRVLLGAVAAVLVQLALTVPGTIDVMFTRQGIERAWLGTHAGLAIWLALLWVQGHQLLAGGRPRLALALEAVGAGWLLATLAMLAWLSGMTFLVGGSLGSLGRDAGDVLASGRGMGGRAMPIVSVVAAGLAAGVAARAWPGLRAWPQPLVGAVLVALAWFLPALGAVWLALAVCVTTQRFRLAVAAAAAAAWVIGSFYYQLAWPLATKALVLTAAGAALGGVAWFAGRRQGASSPAVAPRAARRPGVAALLFAVSAVATLVVANVGIVQKETLIAQGQPVFVALAPVDPRSLMQGDYMQLDFRLPDDTPHPGDGLLTQHRPQVVARRDARGVATLLRIDVAGAELAADELRIELTPKNGRWWLVSDAWYFREGDAQRWSLARYGEFRVAEDGRALLVGMADAALRRIEP